VPPLTLPAIPTSISEIKNLPTSNSSAPASSGSTTTNATTNQNSSTTNNTQINPSPLPNPSVPTTPSVTAPEAGINAPKYSEFQSACRTHDYDQVQYLPDSLKEKRIQFLQDKIKKESESAKLKIRLLKEYVDQKKLKEAEQLLKEIRPLKISKSDSQYAEALYDFGKGDKKVPRDLLNKILENDPNNVDALKLLAEVYKADNNYFEYTSIYYDLSKITKENYDEQLCEALTLDAHYADAEKFCTRGASEKKNPLFSIYLGIAARETQNFKEAQRQFTNSINIKETEMGYLCSGELYALQRKNTEAIDAFKKAIELSGQSTRAQLALAWVYFDDKNRTQALEAFKKACSTNKKVATEMRKAVKFLIDEKSDMVKAYVSQSEACLAN